VGVPLKADNGALRDNPPLTYVIYWNQRKGIGALQSGHASLILDSQQFLQGWPMSSQSKEWYASWLGGGTGFLQRRAASNSFYEDMGQWGGERLIEGGDLRAPTKWVAVRGLDMPAMKEEWDAITGKVRAHWKLLDKNCATVVARILKAGGGDHLTAFHKHQVVWWPTDVIRYAASMGNCVYMTSSNVPAGVA
jgi:hypothetical protein